MKRILITLWKTAAALTVGVAVLAVAGALWAGLDWLTIAVVVAIAGLAAALAISELRRKN